MLKLGFHSLDVLGLVHLHINQADLAGIAGEILDHLYRQNHARQLAGGVDPRHTPFMAQEWNGVANMYLLLPRVEFINQDIVWLLEWTAFNEFKAAAHFIEIIEIHAEDIRNAAHLMDNHTYSHPDMRLPGHEFYEILWHGCAAKAHGGGSRRADHDVRPDTASAILRFIEHPAAQPDQRKNQRYRNGDEQHAQQRPQRAVPHIFDDQLESHSGFFFREADDPPTG